MLSTLNDLWSFLGVLNEKRCKRTESDEGEYLSLAYNDILIHSVGAIQEQAKLIHQQKQNIEFLQTEVEDLKSQLVSIMARLTTAGIA